MPDIEFAPDGLDVTAQPRSVGDAREAIAQTRERISATLDAIELRIDETKQDIRRKADVLRPVRERIGASPWTALGIAAGAGLALGLLTGGDSEEEERATARERRRRLRHQRHAARAQRHEGGPRDWSDQGGEGALTLRDARGHDSMLEDVEEHQHRAGHGRTSLQERVLDHLLHALSSAISDGLSARIRRKLLD